MSDDALPKRGAGGGINPASLSVEDMSRLLSAAGGKRIAPEEIQADIEAGAPVGPDGRMNLVYYAAWLAREVQSDGGGR
jgi:hypothetical protein